MGSCVSLNYCNRGGQSSRSGSGRRRGNRRDLVECNQNELEVANARSAGDNQAHRSPSLGNLNSTNGENIIEPTSNSYQSTISNSLSTNQRFVPPTGKNKRLKRDYVKYLKQSYEGRVWLVSARKMTEAQVAAKRDEFWHTAPAFDGKPEIWAALKASVDALETRNYQLAQAIIDSANIILPNGIINDCYDELGNRYQLPMYVLIKPTNFRRKPSNEQNSNDVESESSDSTSKATEKAIETSGKSKKSKKSKVNKNSAENEENLDGELAVKASKKSKSKASTSAEAAVESLQVKFRISSLNQDCSKGDIKMAVSPSENVLSVKKRLAELYKIEPQAQRFFFAGKMMKDRDKLKAHKLKKNVVIQVVVREKEESAPNEDENKDTA